MVRRSGTATRSVVTPAARHSMDRFASGSPSSTTPAVRGTVPSSDVSAIMEVLVCMHRISARYAALLLAAIGLAPMAVSAQLPRESPTLLRPGSPRGVSLMAVDYGLDPQSGL